ncbi:MAG TPA: DUF3501 family protein [Anaeromyxobacter sp.]|nr:DUF3501 family protein [Anaeromyxobacter sp.]
MRAVRRDEILSLEAYEASRSEIRSGILLAKKRRRVTAGGVLTFLFENTATVRYQVQEMVRAERITREPEIGHELLTYNELLGGPGELGVSLLIEVPEVGERDKKLREWIELPRHLYLRLPGGEKVRPRYDARQVGEDRLSSVQYLKFDVRGEVPVAAGADLPGLKVEALLEPDQREALAEDLRSDASVEVR